MGRDLAEAFPAARAALERVDAVLGTSLSRIMFEGPADELTRTDNAQPALLAHGAAVWAVVGDAVGARLGAAAGHSLGEYTAYHAAGTLALPDAARLVRRRGELMRQAGNERPGTMAAILGDLAEPIDAICQRASGADGIVVPANYNAAEQTVISGAIAAVDRAMELAKAAGAKRAVKLNVGGAFHSPLMASAGDGLRRQLEVTTFLEPRVPVYANVSAGPVTTASEARRLIGEQLTAPVRWHQLMQSLAADFPQALFVEMGPGNVLTGMAKRMGVKTMTCGTVAEVRMLLEDA